MTAYTADTSFLYFNVLALIIFLLFFSMLFAVLFLYFQSVLGKTRKQDLLFKEDAYKKAMALLDDSRKEAQRLVADTNKNTLATLSDAGELSDSVKAALEAQLKALADKQLADLEKITQNLIADYKNAVTVEKQQNLQQLEHVTDDISAEILHEVSDFKDILHKETVEKEQQVEQELKTTHAKIEEELEAYKAAKLKEIEDNIYTILSDISKKVIGKAISIEDQEDYILKILEDIKNSERH